MEEFVGFRPKCYAFKHAGKVAGNKLVHSSAVEKKTAKGVKRRMTISTIITTSTLSGTSIRLFASKI